MAKTPGNPDLSWFEENVHPRPIEDIVHTIELNNSNTYINKIERIYTMENRKGVTELLDGLDFLVSAFNAYALATSETGPGGKTITTPEYLNFTNALIKLPAFITGIGEIPGELADTITEEESALILAKFTSLEIAIERKDEFITDHLSVLVSMKNLIFKWYIKKEVAAPAPTV